MDAAAGPIILANQRTLWYDGVQRQRSGQAVAQDFLGAELASAWGCGVCSSDQILEVFARAFISCPTRAHPCTGTTAAAALERPSLGTATY